jgi:hypothetical protein
MNPKEIKKFIRISIYLTSVNLFAIFINNTIYKAYWPQAYTEYTWTYWLIYSCIVFLVIYPVTLFLTKPVLWFMKKHGQI